METNSRESDRQKLKWLAFGFVFYFSFIAYFLPRASVLHNQIFALCAVLNFAIIIIFILGIRKVYLRMKGLTLPVGVEPDENTLKLRIESDRRRLKGLWIGAGLYALAFLNGLRLGFVYAHTLPLAVIVLGEAFNAFIVTVFIFEIRKTYHRLANSKLG